MKLDTLRLWHDVTPRGGAFNMALDEAMLELADEPWLRVYGWREPTISIGFSQSLGAIPENRRDWLVVRRWTGGGVVEHQAQDVERGGVSPVQVFPDGEYRLLRCFGKQPGHERLQCLLLLALGTQGQRWIPLRYWHREKGSQQRHRLL